MKIHPAKGQLLSTSLPVLVVMVLFIFSDYNFSFKKNIVAPSIDKQEKQKGAHVFGRMDSASFDILYQNNIEWITLVTWGYQDRHDSPIIYHNNIRDSSRLEKNNSELRIRINDMHDAGFKVFFKPHLWIVDHMNGKWRSDVYPTSESDWKLWQHHYRNYILECAQIAEDTKVEMFCIGTELTRLTLEKPDFWNALIKDIRAIYTGSLTYAANWYKEYEEITFWDNLDYIGIQAYFPLVQINHPSVKQLSKGWNKHLGAIESVHKKYNRKILFTELGYKSSADSAIKPWAWPEKSESSKKLFSNETQANCFKAFFNTVWEKEWFGGVHIWKFSSYYKEDKENQDIYFNPQGKPAEEIIASAFED